jgi:HSP20 family protein
MFYAATLPARSFVSPASRSLERFLASTLETTRQRGAQVSQDETSVTLSFDAPGISKEQLAITIEGNVVRIATKEGAPRAYRAAYELAQDIDTATSEARLENGVLTLKLGKVVPVSKATELVVH